MKMVLCILRNKNVINLGGNNNIKNNDSDVDKKNYNNNK